VILPKLVRIPGVSEAAVLSTCNRFEIAVVGEGGRSSAACFLEERLGKNSGRCIYEHYDIDAVRHIFRVAAGLDSLVLGETQILGQVKDAYREAVENGTAGPCLHKVFQYAFKAAKKARTETALGMHKISIAHIALQLAERVLGSIADKKVLVIGSGRMAEIAVRELHKKGCAAITIANRSLHRAQMLANGGCSVISLSGIRNCLQSVDLVVGSIAVERPVLDASLAYGWRRSSPLFMIDLGVPRNFAPELGALENVHLHNIEDLSAIAEEHRMMRREAAAAAELLVEQAVACFTGRNEVNAPSRDGLSSQSAVSRPLQYELR